ncbi:hypothetical protein TNCV_2616981 [Trichonephila clavipes]|nr:hypothetical protein TNCV_2616981 [Trichonephila clavipes]
MCVAWHCPDGTQHLFCWSILALSGQSLALNGPVVDSRYMNLAFGRTEATHNKLVLSSLTKYTVETSWPLLLVWPPFELLHSALTTPRSFWYNIAICDSFLILSHHSL